MTCGPGWYRWKRAAAAGLRSSYDSLDNSGKPSATRIVPELQHPAIGTIFPAMPGMTEGFTLPAIEHERLFTPWLAGAGAVAPKR